MKQLLEAGEIVATHGVRGEVKLLPWADSPEFLLDFPRLSLDGRWYEVEQSRVQKTCVLLKLRGVDRVEDAAHLVKKIASIDRDDAPLPEGSHFIADLIGLQVLSDGEPIGKLIDVLSMPGNDVYVVQGKRRYMIPVVRQFVDEPDYEAGTINVRLIEGMQTDAN
ncbi:MAG: 16S rRNA processing protein RimM [Oscillospiraceae bacterium]|nr:16S rRNA processing protein RimM [Oscillospiraceae bacterium]